jgi:cyclic beta-1,2-glucan synthetase
MSQAPLLQGVADASQALLKILYAGRGAILPPIRSEIFGPQRFAEHGRSLGATHRAAIVRAASFFPRLRSNVRVLREAHQYIGEQAKTGYDISPAAEWLLDNFHLIEAQLKEIHDGLPSSYFRRLPILLDEPLEGLPRVYGIAWAYVAHTDSAFDEDLMAQYLSAYQETRELNLSELWALPTTLRVVLVENLRRLAERIATKKAARAVANLVCDQLESYTLPALGKLLAQLNQRGVGRVFLAQMAQRLQDRRSARRQGEDTDYLNWLHAAAPDLAAAQTQQPLDQAADNLSISNAVRSLRAIGDANWPDVVARTSTLMQLMLTCKVFEAEDTGTRDKSLHAIELLATRCERSEVSVAQTLVGLMRCAAPSQGAAVGASHWLRGPGQADLLAALGLNRYRGISGWPQWRTLALPVYLGTLLAATLGLVSLMLMHQRLAESTNVSLNGWAWVAAFLMVFPASETVVAVINRLISESVKPYHLPRLALMNGIPVEHCVMVAIPGMLTSTDTAHALVHRLHLHYLANPEPCAQFALLTDWSDAASATLDTDSGLLDSVKMSIQALNDRYPQDIASAPPRFVVLHRARTWSQSEARWIGWERKRGKLELLVAALATPGSQAFLDLGRLSAIATGIKYLLTLDSDTQLPPGKLRELVGVAAHPNNQPQLDPTGRRVTSGYGILQPRVATPLPAAADFTLYHWLFAGQCGIDPYSAASSEVYQDVFREGTFTGKGLLNVHAVHAVLSGRLPDEHVLSHDLLEGSIARCAAVTDIAFIEDAPFHADVAASRVHRWTRGDWQLLPMLVNPARYPFPAINRWKMFDNLRRSLVAPMSMGLMLLAFLTGVVSPEAVLLLILAAFSAGPLMGAVAGFSPSRDDVAKLYFYRQASIDLVRALWGGLWHLALLEQQAILSVDAVVRALYRMTISHRHLLQWTTAAAAQIQAQSSEGLGNAIRKHWSLPVVATIMLAALLIAGTSEPWFALALCLLWAATPVWIWWASRTPPSKPDAAIPKQDAVYMTTLARDTWRLFERCVGAQDNHLPPDNLQITPHDMVAHRTSPTNIGLYMLSTACARSFGWISIAEMVERLEATLATLDRLERYRGHFLNWYDTQSCAPLLPRYVSTVDSGNLSGHLLAVAQACLSFAKMQGAISDAERKRLIAVADRCETFAWAAEFGFLYHVKRNLLHIGFRVAEQQLDLSFYDLLASESRLTSLLAIAKGDVPVSHWSALGRPFYAAGTQAGLRSWSGSMFEYLMPTLVIDEPRGSVLRDACQVALLEQMAFASAQDAPWGISESAYAASDHTLAYQYAPQGVPRLALRRTPPDELVIAPYATALAAQIAPCSARRNFAALEQLAARGAYGFIEALDFTRSRQTGSEAFTPVATFMAHHQGMTIVALANVLMDGLAQKWGMANAQVESVASLLHERAPREVSLLYEPPNGQAFRVRERRTTGMLRELVPGVNAIEPTHLLSNGRYGVSLRANGAGWSSWGINGINRYRDDALRDANGSFFYLRWNPQQRPVSITQHPAPDAAAQYKAVFHADRVCFEATWPHLAAHTTVWVSPEDDVEFRQIEIRNASDHALDIELISAFEVTLAEPRADEAHPAFSNLFVRAQWSLAQLALLFERKPRLPSEPAMRAAHFLADVQAEVTAIEVQTDRHAWLGRNRPASHPASAFVPLPNQPESQPGVNAPSVTLITGLDPVCALSVRVRISPHAKALLIFATAASDHEGTLQAIMDKYRQSGNVQRASLMSATLTGIRLRALRISAENFAAIQSLTTALMFGLTRPQIMDTRFEGSAAEVCDRRLLWRFGISGDRPVILVSAGVTQGLGLLRSLAQALRLWSWAGVGCDLVIMNSEPGSYLMALQREILMLRERHLTDTAAPGTATTAFHVLRTDELSGDELSTLHGLARLHFNADGRPLAHHVQEWNEDHDSALVQRRAVAVAVVPIGLPGTGKAASTQGGFDAASGEFRFEVGARARPARPWINVLANKTFGTQVSEAGGGYSWAVNSRLNQLTPWSNDPVGDPPGEWLLLQDRRTKEVWSVTPNAWGDANAQYQIAHGQGYSVIGHRHAELDVVVSWCVDPVTAVKQIRIKLINRGHKAFYLRVIGIAEWMMGANRIDRRTVSTSILRTQFDSKTPPAFAPGSAPARSMTALLCTQNDRSAGFGGGTAFLAVTGSADDPEDWTCDRRELFDTLGAVVLPDQLSMAAGGGLDPCAALATRVRIAPGEAEECVFHLGYAETPSAARALAVQAATVPAIHRMQEARAAWDTLLGATTVKTPDRLFDVMVNRWLLYQTVSCRLWAKAGFYQAGGATGFRDQMQDAMALAWSAPAMLREQIVLCASRQFPQGDVQHWWHAPTGAGVRTHFSDDLLWLPHATAHYLHATGDTTLLDQRVGFIDGPAIPEGAEDAYDTPTVSDQVATVYEHGALAIDKSLGVGVHGLPLMGSGDWNDGMNRVGIEGRGESVWLGWFLCRLVADFAPIARQRGEDARADKWEQAALGWKAALLGPAWDGEWFKRAYFDDGQPLGSHENVEAKIDLIAQAWSVLSGVAPPEMQDQALAAVQAHLVDHEAGLIRLLNPPLVNATPSAGYIQAYPPGIRENGGQYTHAGVWALMAQADYSTRHTSTAEAGDAAYLYFTFLSPAHRAQHPSFGSIYGIEPYVVAGDVYTQPPYVGRGGWSWYTGAAAWLHRAAIESIFGLHQSAEELVFTPCLPSHWPQAELTLRRDQKTMHFILIRASREDALKATAKWQAKVLNVGQALQWQSLDANTSHVIPLLPIQRGTDAS